MSDQVQDIVREFLTESDENLSRLDRELIELKENPENAALVASIFRTVHTIKGTCGFLGFAKLETIAHHAENLLSQVRDRRRKLDPPLVSLMLETLDATRRILAEIQKGGDEGVENFQDLIERLRSAAQEAAAGSESAMAAQHSGSAAGPLANGRTDDESGRIASANIRVGVGLLDKLMDLVGELVLTRNQILQFNAEREDAALNGTSQRLNLITSELQESVMKTRMQPIGVVWNKLPRVVHDVATGLGKQIRLVMDGAETELDRTIIEAIKDPLLHLVRNSCDHGIEPPEARQRAGKPLHGTIYLRAYHEGGQVNIEVGDDGAGIDLELIRRTAISAGLLRPEQLNKLTERETLNLIFHPGFSTARTVTKLSGRGVGMDVVRCHIEKIGGVVDVSSRPGQGVTFKLKIPLTLAIIPGLVVTCGGDRFVIPQVSLLELVRLDGDSSDRHIEHVHGTPVYRRRGTLLPIAYLNRVLGMESTSRSEALSMVVLQVEDRQFGLVVDGISDTQEIVVKPLGKQFKGLTIYAGATIMGDGRVALILDVFGIGQRSGLLAQSRDQSHSEAELKAATGVQRQRLLLFRAGSFERLAVPLSLVARLEEFPRASIERAGDSQVVQYRGRILPLIDLRAVLEAGATPAGPAADPAQVIVFNDGDRSIGILVDQIVDVAEEAVTVRCNTVRKGLLGSGVVAKRVADFLDLNYVIHEAGGDWLQHSSGGPEKKVLLADASSFARGLIRNSLDVAGYEVLEAASVEDALHALEQNAVDVVLAAADLPPEGSSTLPDAIRRRPEWGRIPVISLAERAIKAEAMAKENAGVQACEEKFDRPAMLASLARLASAISDYETGLPPSPAEDLVGVSARKEGE